MSLPPVLEMRVSPDLSSPETQRGRVAYFQVFSTVIHSPACEDLGTIKEYSEMHHLEGNGSGSPKTQADLVKRGRKAEKPFDPGDGS